MALSLWTSSCFCVRAAAAPRPESSLPLATGLKSSIPALPRLQASTSSTQQPSTGCQELMDSPTSPLPQIGDALAGSEPFTLSTEQKDAFDRDGYLVLEGFASDAECSALQQRMKELVDSFDPASISVFSTKNQTKTSNKYFLDSAGNISFFFEENAFDEKGGLKQPKALSINKVGHALHDLDPAFRAFSRSPKMAQALRDLGFRAPLPVQSMYIFKQPGIGGEVVPHQDSTFLYTDPPSCVGLWLAVEDANEGNGCLWALPGSHRGELARRFMRTVEGGVTFDKTEVPHYDTSKFVAVPVPRGSLVVLHGAVVHFSYENKSPVSRHAYSLHVIEGEGCQYPADNWLQRSKSDPPFEPITVQ